MALKKYVKEAYVAFDPQEATFLFERNIKLESKDAILSQIPAMVRHLYFPKKRIKLLIGLLISLPILFGVFTFLTWQNIMASKNASQILAIILMVIIVLIISIIRHYIATFFEIRRLKKLYNNLEWPIESYCAFFAEGILIKSDDMEGVFYWHDFMCIMANSTVLSFNLCPSTTSKGKSLKKYYPRLDTFYIFINGDEEIQGLMKLVSEEIDDLVEFR
jgi:hypothetical protein